MSVLRGPGDARSTVLFPAYAGTKLYCLLAEAHVMHVNDLPSVATRTRGDRESNVRLGDDTSSFRSTHHRCKKRSRKKNKNVKNLKKRDKNLKKTFVNVE